MILLVLYIVLIFINLNYRKSKLCFLSLLLYMWILFGWSYGNADWNIYTNRYNNFEELSSRTEVLFTTLVRGGHFLGMEYRGFLIAISGVCLLLLAKTIFDLSSEPGLVLSLYAIFCFPMDITQVRFFIAFSVVCFGFRYLFKYKETKEKKLLIKWIITVVVACNIHMLTMLILVLLIPVFFKRKVTIIVTAVVNIIFILASSLKSKIFALIALFLGEGKASLVMNQASKYDFAKVSYVWFKTIFIFSGFLAVYFCIMYFFKKYDKKYGIVLNTDKKTLESQLAFTMDCNIIILVIIGLITVTTDFYRIQQIIVFMSYLIYSNYLQPHEKGKWKKNNLVIIVPAVLFAFGALYNLVLNSANIETVFLPIFYNNVIFYN